MPVNRVYRARIKHLQKQKKGTQTSWKDRFPTLTVNDADAAVRAVQIGRLWTRDKIKKAQQNDEDIEPVLTAKAEGRSKPRGDDLHGMTYLRGLISVENVKHRRPRLDAETRRLNNPSSEQKIKR